MAKSRRKGFKNTYEKLERQTISYLNMFVKNINLNYLRSFENTFTVFFVKCN